DCVMKGMHRAVGQQKLAAAWMTRLETKEDAPVIAGPCGIVLGVSGLPVLVQMAIRIRENFVVDGDDRAVQVVATVAEGPVASGIVEVSGTNEVGIFAGQAIDAQQCIGKAIGHVGYA